MAKMNNYFYVDTVEQKGFIIPKKYNGLFSLSGNCIREGFKDNSFVTTSPIVDISANTAKTQSGSIYELQEINKDYAEYLHAIENNIDIVNNWYIETDIEHNYKLCGIVNGNLITRKIISQEKNYVVLEGLGKCFVDWRDYSSETEYTLKFSKRICGLKYPEDFEKCAGKVCRPILFK